MEEQVIPYVQSIDLKELGFDGQCFKVYDNLGFIQDEKEMYNLKLEKVLAPTYRQAFKLFRGMGYGVMDKPFYNSMGEPKVTYSKDIIHWETGKTFKMPRKNSYEEAELDCLIKLIELCKSN